MDNTPPPPMSESPITLGNAAIIRDFPHGLSDWIYPEAACSATQSIKHRGDMSKMALGGGEGYA